MALGIRLYYHKGWLKDYATQPYHGVNARLAYCPLVGAFSVIAQLRRLIVYSTNQDLCPAISSGIPDALHRTDAVVRVFTLWWNFVHSTTTTDFHPTKNYSDILTCTTKSIF